MLRLFVVHPFVLALLLARGGYAGTMQIFERESHSHESPAYVVQLEQSESGNLVVRLRLNRVDGFVPDVGRKTRFTRIYLPGAGTLRSPGKPELPVISVPVLVDLDPVQIEDIRIQVESKQDVVPFPFQPRPKRCGDKWDGRFVCDTKVYQGSTPVPDSWAEVKYKGIFRRLPVAIIHLYPVRYLPKTRTLQLATQMEIVLSVPMVMRIAPDTLSKVFSDLASLFLFGFPQIRDGELELESMLIISHDDFVDSLQSLVEWKEKSGISTTLVPLSAIGETYGHVKDFIVQQYEDPGTRPTYVLLVGDGQGAGTVPFVPSPYGCASDFLYSTIDGDDLYSDVLVGRFSAHTPQDVEIQTTKTIWYEKDIEKYGQSTWIPKSLCISSSEGEGYSNDDYRSDIICDLQTENGYSSADKLYHSNGMDTASNILQKLDEGRGWVTYLGHGSGTTWETTVPPFSIDHIYSLQNSYKLPFIVDISCSNGQFDAPLTDCFAEAWMKTGAVDDPRAAVAIYSSSTPTAWDEPAEMAVGMAHALLDNGIYRWGALAAAGRLYMIQVIGSGAVEEVCHQYVVFGDPSLLLRTKIASPLEVNVPEVLPLGGVEVQVEVAKDGLALFGANVTFHYEDEEGLKYVATKTQEGGIATAYLDIQTPGTIKVTVTAANSLPYHTEIQTTSPGCGVVMMKPQIANCDSIVQVILFDADLNNDPNSPDSFVLHVTSGSDTVGKDVVVQEQGSNTAKFVGQIQLSDQATQTKLGVAHGDTVTVNYHDLDCDSQQTEVVAELPVDCEPPTITQVGTKDIKPKSATVTFLTSEQAFGLVEYGTNPQQLQPSSAGLGPLGVAHSLGISGLAPSTTYYYRVTAVDLANNSSLDDNQGQLYQFTTPDCEPQCENKQCGPDGCGGQCGSCCDNQMCIDGKCIGGDGCVVSDKPGCNGCPCEQCVCDMDAFCCDQMWDDLCVTECIDYCGGCPPTPHCEGKECGPDGCGGVCGICPEGWTCTEEGKCVDVCEPQCQDKECGPDGCGGSCGTCDDGECIDGKCKLKCNGITFEGCCVYSVLYYCEDGYLIIHDCAQENKQCGWVETLAWYDCTTEQKPDPDGKLPLWCPGTCPPQCDGKECGPDGCGGYCGQCDEEHYCEGGKCIPKCKPQCNNKECGDDGCGGNCGTCPPKYTCNMGKCQPLCEPNCHNKECGDDGCGGLCGNCAPGMTCGDDFKCHLPAIGQTDIVEQPDSPQLKANTTKRGGGCATSHTTPPHLSILFLAALLTLAYRCLRQKSGRSICHKSDPLQMMIST